MLDELRHVWLHSADMSTPPIMLTTPSAALSPSSLMYAAFAELIKQGLQYLAMLLRPHSSKFTEFKT
jgi:hypothetical protein